ncbi:hypothetical protein NE599_20620, partial [[Clostridium] symbiosum]|nr:hypothetical protein [[Clostridium] symbiosum]
MEEIIGYGIHKLSLEYHEKMPALTESPHSREMILYKFRFYREHADLILAFHHAKISTTLLDVITDCEIDAYGDMPANSIAKYDKAVYKKASGGASKPGEHRKGRGSLLPFQAV